MSNLTVSRDADGFTPLERRFCEEMAVGHEAGQAYVRAGGSPNGAKQSAHKMLQRPHVAARIEVNRQKVTEATMVTAERVRDEIACMAFFDPTDALEETEDADGTTTVAIVSNPKRLPPDLRRSIIEMTQITVGEVTKFRIKFASKARALDMLAKHTNLYSDDAPASDAGVPLDERLRHWAREDAVEDSPNVERLRRA